MKNMKSCIGALAILAICLPAAAQWTSDAAYPNNIYYLPGNVGIGTTASYAPQRLMVAGNMLVADGGGVELSANGTDWNNATNGLAANWATQAIGGSITFATSIVTGNGFSGNAQRVVYQTVGTGAYGKLYQSISFTKNHLYKISFSYRCSTTLGVVFGDNEGALFLPTNIGNAVSVSVVAGPTLFDRGTLDFFAPGGGGIPTNGTWLEIDSVSVQEATAGNVFVGGNLGIGTSTPSRKIETAVDAVNGTYSVGLRVGTKGLAYGGSGGAIELAAMNNDGTAKPVVVLAPSLYNGAAGAQTGDFVVQTSQNGTLYESLRVASNGDLTIRGNFAAKYQDVAEWVPAAKALDAGTVVVLNREAANEVMPSSKAYDTAVAGVVSAAPGIILGEAGPSKAKVATTGRVKVKVDASKGPIAIGDLLVTSDKPGVAMKSKPLSIDGESIHRPGTLIGKALEPLASGEGEILVLLSLQ